MIIRSLKIGAFAAAALLLGACSSTEERNAIYQDAGVGPSLEMPPGLTLELNEGAMQVPESLATASTDDALEKVGLPVDDFVVVRRDGALQWLELKAEPQVVWQRSKVFFAQYGPELKREQPELMIMDTDWARLDNGEERSFFAKVFGALFADSTRDKFRVRLEAGEAAGTTELYLAHQRMQQQSVGDGIRWLPSVSDRELEIEMLKRLVVFFGLPQERADVILKTVGEVEFDIVSADGGDYLSIGAGSEWVWRRLMQAVDRAGMDVKRADEAAGRLELAYTLIVRTEEPGFIVRIKETEVPVSFALQMSESEGRVRVTVEAPAEGSVPSDDQAQELLEVLLDKLR